MARNRKRILSFARHLARRVALRHPFGLCSVDDVQLLLPTFGHDPLELGSTAGVIFRPREWVATSLRSPSRRASNHRRPIQVWQLALAARLSPLRLPQRAKRGGGGAKRAQAVVDGDWAALLAHAVFSRQAARASAAGRGRRSQWMRGNGER